MMKRKTYQQPMMKAVQLSQHCSILAGSGEESRASVNDYTEKASQDW
jgi:hypothetical protein